MSLKETRERTQQLGLTRIDNPDPPVAYTTPQPESDITRIKDPNAFVETVLWGTPHSK
jgi:hypothetical protein